MKKKKNYNEADAEWEWYIGQLYSQLIKGCYKKKINTVVELAPGFRHKIADALKKLNFDGTIYIIDSSIDVLNYVKDKYHEIIPKANIICINEQFENSFDYFPKEVDLFLSNHSIDDLIISNYANIIYSKQENNEILYNNLIELWDKLYLDKDNQEKVSNEIFNLFRTLLIKKKIGLIILSQYKSNLYFLGKSDKMDQITKKCFRKIKSLIFMDDKYINSLLDFYPFGKDDERYNGRYLLDNTQNAENWIVGKIKSNIE